MPKNKKYKLIRNCLAVYGYEKPVDIILQDNEIIFTGDYKKSGIKKFNDTFNAATCVVMPGFINTHHHLFQTLTKALPAVQNAKLFDWLKYHYNVWKNITEKGFYYSTQCGLGELLLSGVTTCSDHLYLYPKIRKHPMEIELEAAKEIGMRCHFTRGSMTKGQSGGGLPPDDIVEDMEFVLKDSERIIDMFHDADDFSMCRVALAPCSPFSVDVELMKETATLARKKGVRLHTHLAETLDEVEYCVRVFGKRPLALCEEMGWLGPDVWYAHGIFFNDDEIDKLSMTQTGISHCPQSNMRLGSGVCRVKDLISNNVPVSLAVDGSASNDSNNMLLEIRTAVYLQRLVHGPEAMTVSDGIDLATKGGAKVLGRNDIGTIEPGKAADIAVFDLNSMEYSGSGDPIAALIMCGMMKRARRVYANGEIVVDDGELVRVEEKAIIKNMRLCHKQCIQN